MKKRKLPFFGQFFNYPSSKKNPIHEQIENTFKAVKEIYGLDCVPFVGTTGAGKSTSVNTLVGHQMEIREDEDGSDKVIISPGSKDLDGKKFSAKIGHGFVSSTIYPKGYGIRKLPFSYCDSPGLAENRKTYLLPTILGRSLLLALPKRIRGVVVVIDYNVISVGRGKLLKETLVEVQDFFKIKKCEKGDVREASVLYVFTHMPDRLSQKKAKNMILKKLEKLLSEEESKFQSDQNVELIRSCKTILKYPENIFAIYPVNDKINSKAKIVERLCQLKPIKKAYLNDFNSASEISLIKEEVAKPIKEALEIFKEIEDALHEKKKLKDKACKLEANISSLNNDKISKQNELKLIINSGKALNSKAQIIKLDLKNEELELELSNFIEKEKSKINSHNEKIKNKIREITRLDTNENIRQGTISWKENDLFGEVFSGTVNICKKSSLTVELNDPISDIEISYTEENLLYENGNAISRPEKYYKKSEGALGKDHVVWLDKDGRKWAKGYIKETTKKEIVKERGYKTYSLEYATPSHVYGSITIKPYIASKHAYKSRIAKLKIEINGLEKNIDGFKKNISDEELYIRDRKSDNEASIKDWKNKGQDVEFQKENINKQIIRLQKSIKSERNKLEDTELSIEKENKIIKEKKSFLNSESKKIEFGLLRNFLMFVKFTVGSNKEEDADFILFKEKFKTYYPSWKPICISYKEDNFREYDTIDNVNINFEELFSAKYALPDLSENLEMKEEIEDYKNNKTDTLLTGLKKLVDEGYEFCLTRENKELSIKLTNSEDIGISDAELLETFNNFKKSIKYLIESELSLKCGKNKDFFIKPKFSEKEIIFQKSTNEVLDEITGWIISIGFIESYNLEKPEENKFTIEFNWFNRFILDPFSRCLKISVFKHIVNEEEKAKDWSDFTAKSSLASSLILGVGYLIHQNVLSNTNDTIVHDDDSAHGFDL